MPDYDPRRFTIAQLMVSIAVFAFAVALLATPRSGAVISVIAGVVGVLMVIVAVIVALVDLLLGIRCPVCAQWSMSRIAVNSFRDRFYRCASCQARCRRGFLRGWADASTPEFDEIYKRKRPENPWTAPPGVEDEDLIYSKTHVNLLVNKHRRNPNPPDQSAGLPQ